MFERLFGETEEEQFLCLKKKMTITAVLIAAGLLVGLASGYVGFGFVLACYFWGWGALKSLFGFTTLGILFGRNVVIAALLLCAYLIIGAIAGMVCLVLGVYRFIVLLVSRKNDKKNGVD